MNAIQDLVALLQFRFSNHRQQTDGFKWDYTAATDELILSTTNVLEDTLEGLSQTILKIILPKDRAELRQQIAYLIGLRQRQGDAWATFIADCQTRTNNTNKWVQANKQ